MPTTDNTINLIRTKTEASPQLDAISKSLRKTAMISLISFLCIAVVCGSVFTLLQMQSTNEELEQSQLLKEINSLKVKESYILAIKERTKTVSKAMSDQKPWATMLELVSTFAKPPSLTYISVDEQNKIIIRVEMSSMEEILSLTDIIIAHVYDGKIKNPQLASFQIGKDGTFDVSISFFATFESI